MKLKTLKDIQKYVPVVNAKTGDADLAEEEKDDTGDRVIYPEEIKQEAIKEIKELQKIEEIDMIKIPIEKQIEIEKKYFTLFDAVGAYDNSNVIEYIKWKNNITEEDLK